MTAENNNTVTVTVDEEKHEVKVDPSSLTVKVPEGGSALVHWKAQSMANKKEVDLVFVGFNQPTSHSETPHTAFSTPTGHKKHWHARVTDHQPGVHPYSIYVQYKDTDGHYKQLRTDPEIKNEPKPPEG